ncbi:hypothetical protein RRG08_029866 [Elysia crispata]|uniref:Uncharacterized protein n=1 Tax=Elysia crispata TaxID=231223 RepID=A0AAE0YJB7_9GAST|nr:hypothetical protein RRG08_029866 [Elysia crispata]
MHESSSFANIKLPDFMQRGDHDIIAVCTSKRQFTRQEAWSLAHLLPVVLTQSSALLRAVRRQLRSFRFQRQIFPSNHGPAHRNSRMTNEALTSGDVSVVSSAAGSLDQGEWL